ncbi:MAG: hypothetical protein PHO67_08335 [Candidatus Omnitrophica bacterium]|nr:hypothetical protein [Candidatus Omnitrophota bacterium]
MINDYPVNYEKTLAHAKKQTEVNNAIESIDEIENRWVHLSSCEGYSMYDLKKEILLTDITILLRCCIVFINKIAEQEQLIKRQKPCKLLRQAKKIALPMEGRV